MKTRMKKHPSLAIILQVVRRHLLLFLGIFLLILGAIVCSLLPPLVLEKIVDRLAGGYGIPVSLAALYFTLLYSGPLPSASVPATDFLRFSVRKSSGAFAMLCAISSHAFPQRRSLHRTRAPFQPALSEMPTPSRSSSRMELPACLPTAAP